MAALEHSMMPTSPLNLAAFGRPGEKRLAGNPADPRIAEEELIVDNRSGISPAEMVENKLSRRLGNASLPVSHLQTRCLLRSR